MLIIKDYARQRHQGQRSDWTDAAWLQVGTIEDMVLLKLIGYLGYVHLMRIKSARLRILNKIPRLPSIIIENLISSFGEFSKIITATVEELDDVKESVKFVPKRLRKALN